MKSRPIGVALLAALGLIGAVFYFILTLVALFSRDAVNTLLQRMTGGGVGPAPLQALGALLPLYFLVMGLLTLALAWGLWSLKNWALIVSLVIIGLSVLGGIFEIIHGLAYSSSASAVTALVRLVIPVLIFWYLCTPRVRAAFTHRTPAA